MVLFADEMRAHLVVECIVEVEALLRVHLYQVFADVRVAQHVLHYHEFQFLGWYLVVLELLGEDGSEFLVSRRLELVDNILFLVDQVAVLAFDLLDDLFAAVVDLPVKIGRFLLL